MYTKLNEYINVNIDHMFSAWSDKIMYDKNSDEFIFMSLIGFNTTIKDIIKILNSNKGRVFISLKNEKWGYSCSNKYKAIFKKAPNSDYVHAIIYQDDIVKINQNAETYELYMYLTQDEKLEDKVFEKLKAHSSVPLLEEWKTFITDNLIEIGAINEANTYGIDDDMKAYKMYCTKEILVNIISSGLKQSMINIAGNNNPSVLLPSIHGLNDYLDIFGEFLAKKIQTSFKPK